MEWKGKAIILSRKSLLEKSLLITVFSENLGLFKGMSRDTKKLHFLESGNLVVANWKSRIPDALGYIKFDIINNIAGSIIYNKDKLLALQSLISTLLAILPERENNNVIFAKVEDFLLTLKDYSSPWMKKYIETEFALLKELGFPIIANKIKSNNAANISFKSLSGCQKFISYFKITDHFIEKRFFLPYGKKAPIFRKMLLNSMLDKAEKVN